MENFRSEHQSYMWPRRRGCAYITFCQNVSLYKSSHLPNTVCLASQFLSRNNVSKFGPEGPRFVPTVRLSPLVLLPMRRTIQANVAYFATCLCMYTPRCGWRYELFSFRFPRDGIIGDWFTFRFHCERICHSVCADFSSQLKDDDDDDDDVDDDGDGDGDGDDDDDDD